MVTAVSEDEIEPDAAWIASDGRFANVMASGEFEVEPFPDGARVRHRATPADARVTTELRSQRCRRADVGRV
jgi:hypothetical protein